ncbi:MAG TPA: UvrD-helicase domain-containing protein [Planctomycetota bacterium]|nr:UvrD-helicase domain-containing protein [Planctomycetota bacterium]HRR82344.1 UvrD-helicase domain-containing protein [Planctomycetota bacterium]HRT94616.1 UvrD-helicase domain-containing protein [Planctomycetota bacterium]
MSTKPYADAAHRTRAESDLDASLTVEAAAGAGKTSVLVTRLLNFVREGKAPLRRIVAVTFTEKAAGELRVRVREELEKALDGTLDAESRARYAQALDDLGHAPIGTIHAFCAGLIRERPVEAGVDPQFRVLDELEGSLVRDRAWDDWLEEQLAAGNLALLRAVAHGLRLEGEGNTLRALALKMCGCRDLLDRLPAAPPAPDVGPFLAEARQGLADLVALVDGHCNPEAGAAFRSQMSRLGRDLRRAEGLDPMQREAAVMHLNFRRKFPGKKHWSNAKRHAEANTIFEDLKARHEALAAAIGASVAAGVAEALATYPEALRKERDKDGLLDFDDLLLVTRNMLRDSREARDHFKASYDYLLVDEFQDTDPLQVEIAFFLAERRDSHASRWDQVRVEPGKLFFVGDPKQSIYRFRRADIEMYEKARRLLAAQGAALTLSQSFRPVPGIAEAVNAIFEDVIKPPRDGLYQPQYVPLKAYRDATGQRPAVELVYPPPGHEADLAFGGTAHRFEARAVAALIRRIVEEERWEVADPQSRQPRLARYGDIAILAERFTFSDDYAEALAAAGVPLRIVGGKHFYVAHEVHSLVTVLKAIDNPHDRVSLVAALRGPFFGVSDEELLLARQAQGTLSYLAEAPAGPVGEAMAVLREFHGRRNAEPLPLLLQALLERTKALELFLLRPRGEQRVANLLRIVERARALEATERVSFRGFARWLAAAHDTEARETEAPSAEAGDNFVQFLSVHGAKGLEFPIVVLVDMARQRQNASSFVVLRDQPAEAGQFAFYLGSKGDRYRTPNWPGDDYDERRDEAEDARLFYVAATRARDCLVMFPGWAKGEGGPAQFLREAARPEAPEWGAATPKGHVYDTRTLDLADRAGKPFRLAVPTDALPRAAEERLARRTRWREALAADLAKATQGRVTKSPSRLGHGLAPAPLDGVEPPGADTGRQIGSLVHHSLRRAGLDDAGTVERLLEAEARRIGLAAPAAEQARRLLRAALDSPLLARARAASACYHEVPFALEVQGVTLTGAIDLLFLEGDEAVVVDFKTDSVRGEAEVLERAEAYVAQVRAYALAVHRILCKPVKEVVLFFLSAGRLWRATPDSSTYDLAAAEIAAHE